MQSCIIPLGAATIIPMTLAVETPDTTDGGIWVSVVESMSGHTGYDGLGSRTIPSLSMYHSCPTVTSDTCYLRVLINTLRYTPHVHTVAKPLVCHGMSTQWHPHDNTVAGNSGSCGVAYSPHEVGEYAMPSADGIPWLTHVSHGIPYQQMASTARSWD